MQRDFYAFQQIALTDSLGELEQAEQSLKQARGRKDRDAIHEAERKCKQAAKQAAQIEPHLAYLWFEAHGSGLDNAIRDAWQEKLASSAIPAAFHFLPDDESIYQMPALSFLLRIPFRLHKPYLSKDDGDFYLLDNPVRKEKIFQVPMVAATAWKGAFRATLWQLNYREEHEVTVRLLGNPRESEVGQAGRLHFFATFFDKIGLEVINPHSRESGIGERGPILMECVPQGTIGTLLLLYVPFGIFDQREVAQDLKVVAQGLQAMLTTYGFGAKTSSGFGVVEEQLAKQGKLLIRAALSAPSELTDAQTAPSVPSLARYLETPARLHADFRRSDNSLKTAAEYEALLKGQGRQYSKQERQLYEKAQKWWKREGRQLAEAAAKEPVEQPSPTAPPQPPVTERTFEALSGLQEQAQQVAEQLCEGGQE